MKILALSGFLGQSHDFDVFLGQLREHGLFKNSDIKIISVCQDLDMTINDWQTWRQSTIQELKGWAGVEKIFAIGYSLGGRLLLSLLDQSADLFKGAVFVSTNQGLADEQQKSIRKQSDLDWSHKFLSEPWPQLMTDWNAQPVFRGEKNEPTREENAYQRHRLSKVLQIFSLSLQPNFESFIQECHIPQFWAAGAKDKKFVEQLLQLKRQKKIGEFHAEIISDSGHRILFDQPTILATEVAAWAQLFSFCLKP